MGMDVVTLRVMAIKMGLDVEAVVTKYAEDYVSAMLATPRYSNAG